MDYSCKMCGEILSADMVEAVCECEYCGSRQTLPTRYFGEHAELYARACELRFKTDFERAQKLFRQLSEEIPDEPEGYWGLVLCRCGVEYTDDPVSGMKIPVCRISSGGDIASDENYLRAIELASPEQSPIYRREGAAIEMLRREMIERVGTGERYDVFICCRETDESGRSTPDSVIASEIYAQLIREGFGVFYAAETLGGSAERDSELYSAAAINSAKVMLIVGARPESFNAPVMKSILRRCRATVKKDGGRLIIPCIKNMDPRSLPAELAQYPAKDVSRLGFLPEVIRSIRAVLAGSAAVGDSGGVRRSSGSRSTPEKLLRRIRIFLMEEDFDAAQEYSDMILDAAPECWQAHFAKFLAGIGCRCSADLFLEEVIDSFGRGYVQDFGYDYYDDELFRSRFDEILGEDMKRALECAKGGPDSEQITTVYERLVSAVRDDVYLKEQEEIDIEEKSELDRLRRSHDMEEDSKRASRRKKQQIRTRFLTYMAVFLAVMILLLTQFHMKWAIAPIIAAIPVTLAVLAGLEK